LNEQTTVDTTEGYALTRFNALRHGVLSRFTLLPWEDPDEYAQILDALVAAHNPEELIEEHLVEELAGIIWRKRRLRLAEGAAFQRGLKSALAPFSSTVETALAHAGGAGRDGYERPIDAIRATEDETREELADLARDEAKTEGALRVLDRGGPNANEKALATLRADTREWWEEKVGGKWAEDENDYDDDYDDEPPAACTLDADGLALFLRREVTAFYTVRRRELENRPLIKAHTFGEAFSPDRLDRIARYEVHLDRKLEKTLAMLIKLQELRQTSSET
jgi:hypothetical protein